MGREARRPAKTVEEHITAAAVDSIPPKVRYFLRHPRLAFAVLCVTWPLDVARGAWLGGCQAARNSRDAIGVFWNLARGKDAL